MRSGPRSGPHLAQLPCGRRRPVAVGIFIVSVARSVPRALMPCSEISITTARWCFPKDLLVEISTLLARRSISYFGTNCHFLKARVERSSLHTSLVEQTSLLGSVRPVISPDRLRITLPLLARCDHVGHRKLLHAFGMKSANVKNGSAPPYSVDCTLPPAAPH